MPERFDKFTERAKKVLVLAEQEAQRFNHNYIGTEHLLLGLVAEGQGVAAKVLSNLGIELPRVREAILFIVGRGDKPASGNISLTPRAKRVIELAVEEARNLNHNYIGTEHLLLGLIREGEGIAAGVLESLGVSLESARRQVIQVVSNASAASIGGEAAGVPSVPRTRDNVVTCRVDDGALNALDALVEAGVHDTRSEAAARLINAGMEANRPLLEKVYAAVAEIRRVREETQRLARTWKEEGASESADDGEAGGDAPGTEPPQPQE